MSVPAAPSLPEAGGASSSTGTAPPTPKPISLSPPMQSTSSPPLSSSLPTPSLPHPSDTRRLAVSSIDLGLPGMDSVDPPFLARPLSRADSRSRSKSPGGMSVISGEWKKSLHSDAATSTGKQNQYMRDLVRRPWRDPPKRQKTVPAEQTEAWAHTRERVAQAAASILGNVRDVAHEALFIGVDIIEFAPIPGLAGAARALLNIWDAMDLVDMNRLQCLRLTERCAEILLSIRQEVHDTGDDVGTELAVPYQKLLEAFDDVHELLLKQAHRPWIKRYLKRDEILGMIAACDAGLTEALGRFSISIQIRILRKVQESEARRQEDTQRLIESLIRVGAISPDYIGPPSVYNAIVGVNENALQLTGVGRKEGIAKIDDHPPQSSQKFFSKSFSGTVERASPSKLSPAQVLSTLCALHDMQNSRDAARDLADLRNSMRAAMQTGNDAELCAVLQVARDEMPEALKTLQRALERLVEKQSREGSGEERMVKDDVGMKASESGNGKEKKARLVGMLKRTKTVMSAESSSSGSKGSASWSGSEGWSRDTLDREFIESGIDALRRMSGGETTSLPSWTITRYEVDREKIIGVGFFSDVYRGTWRGRTVAIKVVAETTPRELFRHEVEIWSRLQHPHILMLCGASSAAGDPPWFFVSPYERNGNLVQYLKNVEAGWSTGGGIGVGGDRGGRGRSVGGGERLNGDFGIGDVPKSPSPGRKQMATFPVWDSPSSPRHRQLEGLSAGPVGPVPREWDLYRLMHEIAKGMEYLHANGVLHSDLKAANVLVDGKLRCVISDFGQSKMKSEACRIGGTQPPHGTLRWQAPELMSGLSPLTTAIDVYAYAISCTEILSMGGIPWPSMDNDAIRQFVLRDNIRPTISNSRFNTPALQELLRVCWHSDPAVRPSFEKIVLDVRLLRKNFGSVEEAVKYSPAAFSDEIDHISRPSPDMKPVPMLVGPPLRDSALETSPASSTTATASTPPSFHTAQDASGTTPSLSKVSHREETVSSSNIQMPEPVFYTPGSQDPVLKTFDTISASHTFRVTAPSSRASSLFTHTPSSPSEENLGGAHIPEYDGYASPPPVHEWIAEKKNEQRYRILLTHQFHRSLTLPLWTPTPVDLGAVGYLSKPSGTFVTLFDAFHPENSSNSAVRSMPSLYGYGRITKGSQRKDERNAAQRGIDAFVGMLAFKKWGVNVSQRVSRRYSFPLRSGHKAAYMCTETTVYDYMDNLDTPKKWFTANVHAIMQTFGTEHRIQKEDLFLVIGTLKTPNHALFVTHHHPDGQVHFNVFSSVRNGRPWGIFTTDTEAAQDVAGPSYDEFDPRSAISASKVSTSGGPWDTILIARLRFKPDVLEPTSL